MFMHLYNRFATWEHLCYTESVKGGSMDDTTKQLIEQWRSELAQALSQQDDETREERTLAVCNEVRRAYEERGVPYRRCLSVLDELADQGSFYTRNTRAWLKEGHRLKVTRWLFPLAGGIIGALVAYASVHYILLPLLAR